MPLPFTKAGRAVRATERAAAAQGKMAAGFVASARARSSAMNSADWSGLAKAYSNPTYGPFLSPQARAAGMGAAINKSRANARVTPPAKSWIRRLPATAMGAAGLGLGGMSLLRNQGPGATGNGYRPTGTSSGARRF